jgi:hypothetical protein
MLVHRFGILRKPLPQNIKIGKIGALVYCLCKLHNYCVGEHDDVVPQLSCDPKNIEILGGVQLVGEDFIPSDLLDRFESGSLSSTVSDRRRRRSDTNEHSSPRDVLLDVVVEKDLKRPRRRR